MPFGNKQQLEPRSPGSDGDISTWGYSNTIMVSKLVKDLASDLIQIPWFKPIMAKFHNIRTVADFHLCWWSNGESQLPATCCFRSCTAMTPGPLTRILFQSKPSVLMIPNHSFWFNSITSSKPPVALASFWLWMTNPIRLKGLRLTLKIQRLNINTRISTLEHQTFMAQSHCLQTNFELKALFKFKIRFECKGRKFKCFL